MYREDLYHSCGEKRPAPGKDGLCLCHIWYQIKVSLHCQDLWSCGPTTGSAVQSRPVLYAQCPEITSDGILRCINKI